MKLQDGQSTNDLIGIEVYHIFQPSFMFVIDQVKTDSPEHLYVRGPGCFGWLGLHMVEKTDPVSKVYHKYSIWDKTPAGILRHARVKSSEALTAMSEFRFLDAKKMFEEVTEIMNAMAILLEEVKS